HDVPSAVGWLGSRLRDPGTTAEAPGSRRRDPSHPRVGAPFLIPVAQRIRGIPDMTGLADTIETEAAPAVALGRCLTGGAGLAGGDACPVCGRAYPEVEGIVHAIGPLSGTNRIAAGFYDGPCWPRFRPWEQLFLWFQGKSCSQGRNRGQH